MSSAKIFTTPNFLAILFAALTILFAACNGPLSSGKGSDKVSGNPSNAASGSNANGSSDGNSGNAAADRTGSTDPLIDSAKLKSEMNDLLNSIATGKPDTTKLKKMATDVLTTTATVLSDSGISALGGNNADPAQTSAREALIKMRNGMGITPAALDSMKKTAAGLK